MRPELTLMDDYYLMLYAQMYPEDFSMILSEFIGIPLEIKEDSFHVQQVVISPDNYKDIRFDIFSETVNGERFVLEVESRKKFSELRLRFYTAKHDSQLLMRGGNYSELPDSYTVVVSRNDIRGKGQPRYILRTCYVQSLTEAGKDAAIFEDGKVAIYINASYSNEKDDSIIVKNTEKGWDRMTSEAMAQIDALPLFGGRLLTDEERMEEREEGREEGRMEGREEGRMEGREEGRMEGREEGRMEGREEGRMEGREEVIIKTMYRMFYRNKDVNEIAETLDIPKKTVDEYRKNYARNKQEIIQRYGFKKSRSASR